MDTRLRKDVYSIHAQHTRHQLAFREAEFAFTRTLDGWEYRYTTHTHICDDDDGTD